MAKITVKELAAKQREDVRLGKVKKPMTLKQLSALARILNEKYTKQSS
tara:strand:- start:1098 stop:1241 length:144 start_codon:yes stop_codon:yes gene_type:complete